MVLSNKSTTINGYTNKTVCIMLISLICGVASTTLLLWICVTDPIILALRYYTRVTNGSLLHQMMYRELEGAHLSASLFNITNAERFVSGEDEKLKVEEVGPFTYKERRRLEDIKIDFENERMSCSPKISLEFMPEKSVGLPEEMNLTMPNLPMMGLMSQMSSYPYFARVGMNMLMKQLNSKPLVNIDAFSYLWGYKDKILTLANTVMPGAIRFDKMGILDRIYDPKNPFQLEASLRDDNKFMILSRNGKKKLQISEDVDVDHCELCESFENVYEGIGYPVGLTPEYPIRLFKNGICKILDVDYVGNKKTDFGGEAMVYHFSDKFFSWKPNETSNNGVLDMSVCFYGTPLAVTKAHFLDMDPALYSRIEGMKPDEKYRGWIAIEPKGGMQVETQVTLQMNLLVRDVSHSPELRAFSDMILPICIIHIVQPPLPKESTDILHSIYVTGPYVIWAMRALLTIIALLSWSYVFRDIYRNVIMPKIMVTSISIEKVLPSEEPLMSKYCISNIVDENQSLR